MGTFLDTKFVEFLMGEHRRDFFAFKFKEVPMWHVKHEILGIFAIEIVVMEQVVPFIIRLYAAKM